MYCRDWGKRIGFSTRRQNRKDFLEILVILSVTVVWNELVYYSARWIAKSWYHYDITTAFDRLIPFLPWTVSIYFGCLLVWGVNYLLCALQNSPERDRFFCADMLAKAVCFLFFVAIPTTNIRPDLSGEQGIWASLMKLLYQIDSPDNLFPSIHCLVSWFCWIGVRKRTDIPFAYRCFSLVAAIAVCISTLTTRQHVIADVIGGVLLAEICYWVAGIPKVCRVYRNGINAPCKLLPKQQEQPRQ